MPTGRRFPWERPAAYGPYMASRPEPASALVDRAIMRQRWEYLTFLHWPVDAETMFE